MFSNGLKLRGVTSRTMSVCPASFPMSTPKSIGSKSLISGIRELTSRRRISRDGASPGKYRNAHNAHVGVHVSLPHMIEPSDLDRTFPLSTSPCFKSSRGNEPIHRLECTLTIVNNRRPRVNLPSRWLPLDLPSAHFLNSTDPLSR